MAAPTRNDVVAAATATLLLVALAALSNAQFAAAGGLEDVVPTPGHLITPPPELPANLRKATPRAVHTQCGTVTPPETKIASAESTRLAVEASRVNQRSSGLARKKIRVVFHIIYTSFYSSLFDQTFYTGYVSKTQLTAQVKLLNDAFAGRRGGKVDTNTKFYWNSQADWWIYDVTNVTTGDYFNLVPDDKESLYFKRTFRKGNSVTLNVYTANLILPDRPGVTLLGYATFPWDYKKKALYDGIYMNYDAMTGGEFTDFSQGVTLAHEVGHWAGLFHTFQGGCSTDPKKGDRVADTVPEATSASGCPKNRKTCKGRGYNQKWRDPVNNIMDYTTDKCRTTLTRGQATRADSAWATWRGCKACLKIKGEAPPRATRK